MPKIRVCHLTFDMHIGGAEQVIRNLVAGTNASRFECTILCIEEKIGPFGQLLIEQGVSVTAIARREGFDYRLIPKIRRFLSEQKIDILHCHQYTPWVYGALAASFTSTKVIFTEHGRFYPDSSSWKRRLVNPVLLKGTDCVTAISRATREALNEFEYIPLSKIEVIYNGIHQLQLDTAKTESLRNELKISPDSQVVGTVARLDPVKNQQMMIRAFNLILQEHPNTILLMVGDGVEMQSLRKLVATLDIDKKVFFTGYIAQPEFHIQLMDIFLLSSLTEGTSMTLLEAMSVGVPCIVTNAGGNPEIIEHGYNGLVTESGNVEEFASAISSLLSDQELNNVMGENAKYLFDKKFAANLMCTLFENRYATL